jgi:hypothetical protein
MSYFKISVISFALLASILISCKKKEENVTPTVSNEGLSTVRLKLVNSINKTDTVMATFKLSVTTGEITDSSNALLRLKANSIYNSEVVLLDTTQSPLLDATEEIRERKNFHLFFYQPSPISASNLSISTVSPYIPSTATSATGPYLNLSVKRTDYDDNKPALEVGLSAKFTTGAASTGRLRFVLRHQPDGKNGGYDAGTSDIDVSYKVTIY